jgi:hypothetical protein
MNFLYVPILLQILILTTIKLNQYLEKQNDATITIDYFDCNEGDIKSTTKPTEANLFKAKSQVYNKTAYYF